MATKNFSYEDMQTAISKLQKDCENIRSERQKDYGFHFYDNYNKYGLQGFLINDGEITARLEQICNKISEKQREIPGDDYCLYEKSLRNALYDGINYRLLFLFWLEREKWANKPRCYFNDTQDTNFNIVSDFVENEHKPRAESGIKGNSFGLENSRAEPPRGVNTDKLGCPDDIYLLTGDILHHPSFPTLTSEDIKVIRKLFCDFFKE